MSAKEPEITKEEQELLELLGEDLALPPLPPDFERNVLARLGLLPSKNFDAPLQDEVEVEPLSAEEEQELLELLGEDLALPPLPPDFERNVLARLGIPSEERGLLRLYNTLTREKEVFQPLDPGNVRIYSCGPTVYGYQHIGNYRAYIFEDLLRRYLKYRGYTVTQVMNLTDVEDRIIRSSRQAGISLHDFTAIYKTAFFEDLRTLNIEPAEVYPAAADHIPTMVALIQQLQERGYTYTIDGSIYFRMNRFPDYGKLSHRDAWALQSDSLEQAWDTFEWMYIHQRTGAYVWKDSDEYVRLNSDEYGRDDKRDFALWKAWKPEDGDVFWETALGKGRPAWHIECSAMAMHYLGNHFDIHTGGEDNIFPHHENEIAQSEAATGEPFVNYWLHCGQLLFDNQKMSQYLGNFYTLRNLLKMRAKPKGLRYALLSIYYRQPLNFTFESLRAAEQAVQRLLDFMQHLRTAYGEGFDVRPLLALTQQRFEAALDDDLNISGALAAIFEMIREVNRAIAQHRLSAPEAQQVTALMQRFDTVLGLLTEDKPTGEPLVEVLLQERQSARQRGDFARADRLRAQIQELGYIIEDTPQGARLKRLGVHK